MKMSVLVCLVALSQHSALARTGEIHLLSPAVQKDMKKGSRIDLIWLSPRFDGAKGIRVGTTSLDPRVQTEYGNLIEYIPKALHRIATPDAPNVISITVTTLDGIDRGSTGYYSATVAIEGQITGPDGALLGAFATRVESNVRETVQANFRAVVDKIVWQIAKDLGAPFGRSLESRSGNRAGLNPEEPAPRPAVAPAQELGVQERLLRLDDLRKKGLISEEEYKQHREKILGAL